MDDSELLGALVAVGLLILYFVAAFLYDGKNYQRYLNKEDKLEKPESKKQESTEKSLESKKGELRYIQIGNYPRPPKSNDKHEDEKQIRKENFLSK